MTLLQLTTNTVTAYTKNQNTSRTGPLQNQIFLATAWIYCWHTTPYTRSR